MIKKKEGSGIGQFNTNAEVEEYSHPVHPLIHRPSLGDLCYIISILTSIISASITIFLLILYSFLKIRKI